MPDLQQAVARFGAEARAKLSNPGATGEPEDQLRAPLEGLFADLAELCGFQREHLAAVGESALATLKTRPDYAITLRNVLVGFVEVKAPGKGADPRRFKGHDKEQWDKLQSLPNLLYTDGNAFSLWQNGELVGSIVAVNWRAISIGSILCRRYFLCQLPHQTSLNPGVPSRITVETRQIGSRSRAASTTQTSFRKPVNFTNRSWCSSGRF
jgi:hypothetical protein